jgi:hypothetical protein
MVKVSNEFAICISAPQCYMKRMKPGFCSEFVGRPRQTSEKRSPINKSATVLNLDNGWHSDFQIIAQTSTVLL